MHKVDKMLNKRELEIDYKLEDKQQIPHQAFTRLISENEL